MNCERCNQRATVHVAEVTDGKPHELHLCDSCAMDGGYVTVPRVLTPGRPNTSVYPAKLKAGPAGYLTIPHRDGVEFLLPRIRLTRERLLLPLVYFVMQSVMMVLGLCLMVQFGFQGALWGKVLIVLGLALLPLMKGAAQQLVTGGARIQIKPDRLIVPPYQPKKQPVEVPLVTIARFELDLPPMWQVRIGYRTPRLMAEHFNGSRTLVAMNYPPEVLQSLAEDLRNFARAPWQFFEGGYKVPAAERATISIADVSEIPPIERDVISKPFSSKIRSAQEGDLHTFYMRNGGLFRNRIFLLMYCSITLLPLLILGPIVIRGMMAPAKWRPGALPIIAFGDAVVVAAVVALVVGVHCWSKKYVLVIRANGKEPGSLTCVGRGIFGGREMMFARGEMRGASTRASRFLKAMHIQETEPQAVLFVVDVRGRKRVMLSGEELEMRWVATRIRALLDLPRR